MKTQILTTWRDEAIEALRSRPAYLSLEDVAKGSGLSVGWLKSLAQGRSMEPSVNRVETLLAYLRSVRSVRNG